MRKKERKKKSSPHCNRVLPSCLGSLQTNSSPLSTKRPFCSSFYFENWIFFCNLFFLSVWVCVYLSSQIRSITGCFFLFQNSYLGGAFAKDVVVVVLFRLVPGSLVEAECAPGQHLDAVWFGGIAQRSNPDGDLDTAESGKKMEGKINFHKCRFVGH